MTDVNLTISGKVESLHLEPGDKVIVTLDDDHVHADVIRCISDQLTEVFAPHQVVVLANGLRITKAT